MVDLPDMPKRIAALPKDRRGYPIPRFVDRRAFDADGNPDFRVADAEFRARAYRAGLCWVCGGALGRNRVYVVGPMCLITQTTSEPASHRECAEFAAQACPFLTKPRMRRNEKDLPEEASVPGVFIARNPGVACLYETRRAEAETDRRGSWLIALGRPERVDWWAEGRRATRNEVWASIESGYPLLLRPACEEGPHAVQALEAMKTAAMRWMPALEPMAP